ncbi:hypothetical protein V8C86DRAFT_2773987 [Haematococcus lacustris]
MPGHNRSLSSVSSLQILQVDDELPPNAESGCGGTLISLNPTLPALGERPEHESLDSRLNKTRNPAARQGGPGAMPNHSPAAVEVSLPSMSRGTARKCSFLLPSQLPRHAGGGIARLPSGVPDTTALAPAPADQATLCDSGGQPFRRRSIELPRPTSALRSTPNLQRLGSAESQSMTPGTGSISTRRYNRRLSPIASLQAPSTPMLSRLPSLRSPNSTSEKTACLLGAASLTLNSGQQHQLSQTSPIAVTVSDPFAGPARHAAALRTKSLGRLPSMRLQEVTSPQTLPSGSSSNGSHPLNMGAALVAWLMKPVQTRSTPSSSGVDEAE